MQNIGIFTIYDEKAKRYDTPFFAVGDIQAERRFIQLCNTQNTLLFTFKNDFKLYSLGSYNVESGEILQEKRLIMDGIQVERI